MKSTYYIQLYEIETHPIFSPFYWLIFLWCPVESIKPIIIPSNKILNKPNLHEVKGQVFKSVRKFNVSSLPIAITFPNRVKYKTQKLMMVEHFKI